MYLLERQTHRAHRESKGGPSIDNLRSSGVTTCKSTVALLARLSGSVVLVGSGEVADSVIRRYVDTGYNHRKLVNS